MTGRFKKASVTPNNQAWYDNNRSNLIDNNNASTKRVDDEYYDDETLSAYDDRLKAKKKSHNSLESEEMTSDDGCVTTPEESDLSESDEDASQPSLASPGSYEDLVRLSLVNFKTKRNKHYVDQQMRKNLIGSYKVQLGAQAPARVGSPLCGLIFPWLQKMLVITTQNDPNRLSFR